MLRMWSRIGCSFGSKGTCTAGESVILKFAAMGYPVGRQKECCGIAGKKWRESEGRTMFLY